MPGRDIEGTWSIEPHTEAKLAILRSYLQAWYPILSFGGFKHAIYIDGFAGPGRYADGQDGSPILALKALAEHAAKLNTTFEFHFVELVPRHAASLATCIDDLRGHGLIDPRTVIHLHAGLTFEQAYRGEIRSALLANPGAPAFALVDPFGWTGIPMNIHEELLRRRSTELLVNFMFEEINRFLGHPDQPSNFDQLFGGADWRSAVTRSGVARRQYLHDYYRDQLRSVGGAQFVRSFEMRNKRGAVDYFLFFATKSLKGLEKMKEAMWRIDPAGGFAFSDVTDTRQAVLFQPEPDDGALRRLIEDWFAGQRTRVAQVESFVVERTPFLATHYKRVLRRMEADRRFTVIDPPLGRRSGTYGNPNMVLEFAG